MVHKWDFEFINNMLLPHLISIENLEIQFSSGMQQEVVE